MTTLIAVDPTESVQATSESTAASTSATGWSNLQLWSFRAAFVFVLQLVLPLQSSWYKSLASTKTVGKVFSEALGGRLQYYAPSTESGRYGIGSFASWGIALLVSVLVASVWTWVSLKRGGRREYRALYYWLRLAARYWVAVNIMNYGYMKVFPNQMPFPSISNLHTLFGEHATYRLYWQAVGLVTWYEVVLGLAETVAGILLFFRSTTAVGALLNLGILANVGHANLAYDGGVHIHSFTIALLSLFILLQYVPDVWNLIVLQKSVKPDYYRPKFTLNWQRYAFHSLQWLILLAWIPGYAYYRFDQHYHTSFSKEPRGAGLTGAAGYYTVTEFTLNGKTIAYSPLSPSRWHDVAFEDYPTLSYKVDRAFPILLDNGSPAYRDEDKRYELSGFAGGRQYYHYELDEKSGTLTLQNKYKPVAGDGARRRRPNATNGRNAKSAPPSKLVWHFERPSQDRIILSGIDEERNTFYAVLDRDKEPQIVHVRLPVQGQALQYTREFGRRLPVSNKASADQGDLPPN